jgi:hypothetical protein
MREDEAGRASSSEGTGTRRAEGRGTTDMIGYRRTETASGSGITTTEGGVGTYDESTMTGATTRARRKMRRAKMRMSYMQQVKPVFEMLLGHLELVLLGGMEGVTDTRTENEWRTADCPTMVRLFVNKQKEFVRFVLEATSQEEVVGRLMTLQWAWDSRKTKQDTEESLQEAGQLVFNTI